MEVSGVREHRVYALFMMFTGLFFSVFLSGLFSLLSSPPASATNSASITISNSISIDTLLNETNVYNESISVDSTCSAGYNLTVATTANSNLYLNGDSTTGASISPVSSTYALSSSSNANTWGYSLTNTPDEVGAFKPLSTTPSTLKTPQETAVPSGSISDVFSVYYGVHIANTPPGAYTMENNGIITYQLTLSEDCSDSLVIDFHDNASGDTVTNLPTDSDNTYDTSNNTVTLSTKSPVRSGYTFKEWNTAADGTGSYYYPGQTVPMGSSGLSGFVDLYAIWVEDCPSGYICYDGNHADAGAMSNQEATNGSNIVLIASNFSRANYGFAGWNTAPDGSGTNYGPNATIKMVNSGGLNLYATWIASSGTLQTWAGASNMSTGEVKALRDNRDNEVYTISKLADNKIWTTENLRLIPGNVTFTAANTNNPTATFISDAPGTTSTTTQCSDDLPACTDQIYFYSGNMDRTKTQQPTGNDSQYAWYSYGTMYNWYTATAGHGTNSYTSTSGPNNNGTVPGDICPSGWHVPTGGSSGEYNTLVTALGGTGSAGAKTLRAYPNNFIFSGDYNPSTVIPDGRGTQGRIWEATASTNAKTYRMGYNSSSITPVNTYNKWDNFAVRCMYQGGNIPFSNTTVSFAGTGITSITFTNNNYGTETATPGDPVVSLAENTTYAITATTSTGYELSSWATSATGTLGSASANPTTYIITGDSTLTATGAAIPTYTTTVSLGAGATSITFSNPDYTDQTVSTTGGTVLLKRGVTYTISATYEEGYTLDTWSTTANGTLGNASSATTTYTITGDTTLSITTTVAELLEYTLHYDGGTGSTNIPADNEETSYHDTYEFTIDTTTIPSKFGHSFVGYSETSGASTATYVYNSSNGTFTPSTITVSSTGHSTTKTLYAVYAEDTCPANKICYFDNGADSVDGGKGTMADQSATSNSTATLIPTNYSKTGYGFAGWITSENATPYGPNATISTGDLSSSGLKLYAKWVASSGNLQGWNGCNGMNSGDVTALTDTRDNQVYAVAKLADDNCWTIENLRLDPSTATINNQNTNNPASGFATAAASSSSSNALCTADDSSACINQLQYNTNSLDRSLTPDKSTAANNVGWYSYGVYYNWFTATAGNGNIDTASGANVTGDICPKNWHLPTSTSTGEWAALNTAANGGVTNADAGLRSYPVNLIWSGDYNGSSRTSGYSNGRYWSATGFDTNNAYRMGHQASGTKGSTPSGNYRKWDGFAVRCVYDGEAPVYSDVVVTLPQGVSSITFQNNKYGTETATSQDNTVSLVQGATYTMTANIAPGYEFTSWTAGQNATLGSSSQNPTTLVITDDATLTLTASQIPSYTVTVNLDAGSSSVGFYHADYGTQTVTNQNNNGDGTHTGTVTLYSGASYTITSSFSTSYEFASWSTTANGTLGSASSASTTYQVTGAATLSLTSQLLQPPVSCNTPVPNVTYMQDINASNYNTVINSLTTEAPYYLRDSRDGEPYCVSKLQDGNLWLLDNLRLDLTDSDVLNNTTASNTNASATSLGYLKNGGGTTSDKYAITGVTEWTDNPTYASGYSYSDPLIATSGNCSEVSRCVNDPESGKWTKDSVATSYGNGSGKIGVYYNYCAASAGSYCYGSGTNSGDATEDLCPAGWRMPTGNTSGEYNTLYTAYSSNQADYKAALSTPLSGGFNNGSAFSQGSIGEFWSSTKYNDNLIYNDNLMCSLYLGSGYVSPSSNSSRYFGRSMRCLLDQPTYPVTVSLDSYISSVTFTDGIDTYTATSSNPTVNLKQGKNYTTTATIATGYELASWSTTANGTLGSTTANPTTYTVTGDSTLTVTSQAIPTYQTTVNFAGSGVSSVSFTNANYGTQNVTTSGGTASLRRGVEYIVTTTLSSGYEFLSYATTSNGTLGSISTNPTTYTITGTTTLTVTGQQSLGPAPATSCTTPVPNLTYMQDITSSNRATVLASLTEEAPYYLRDSRDGEPYCVSKLKDGNLWLLDNLRLDLTDSTILTNITTFNTNASAASLGYLKNGGGTTSDQYAITGVVEWTDSPTYASSYSYSDPLIATSGNCSDASYCVNDPESGKWTKDSVATSYGNGSGKIGVYYNYCAASAGSYCYGNGTSYGTSSGDATEDLCPAGWRMPSGGSAGEYQALYTAYNSDATSFKNALSTPLPGTFYNGSAYNQDSYVIFWSSTRDNNRRVYYLNAGSFNVYPTSSDGREGGLSMRCLLDPVYSATTVNFSGSGISSITFEGDNTSQTVSTSGDTVRLKQGVNYTVTATTSAGYELASWSTTASGTLSSTTANPTTYTISDDTTLTLTTAQTPSYTVNVTIDSGVTSLGIYHADYSTITLTPATMTDNQDGTYTGTVTLYRNVGYTITGTYNTADDYAFDSWSTTGSSTIDDATSSTTTFTITGTATLSLASEQKISQAILLPGQELNTKMKTLAEGKSTSSTEESSKIKALRMAASLPAGFTPSSTNTVSVASSEKPIYIFFDNTNNAGVMYFYTEAREIVMNQNSRSAFSDNTALTDISALANWNTSSVTNMRIMFRGASSLTSIEALANWDTSSVADMLSMFRGASSLSNIDGARNWDTSSVTDMNGMFSGTSSLISLNGAINWDIENVTDISHMFYDASSLSNIDGARNWNTSSVTDMNAMFASASSLTNIDALANWDTSNVIDMSHMFQAASSLTNIDALANWDTSSVTNMCDMFSSASSLTNIDGARNWNTSNVINMTYMFSSASSITDVSVINDWDISAVKATSGSSTESSNYFYKMFYRYLNPAHPEFTKRSGTWNSDGTFIPGDTTSDTSAVTIIFDSHISKIELYGKFPGSSTTATQTISSSGNTISLIRGNSYRITATLTSNYELALWNPGENGVIPANRLTINTNISNYSNSTYFTPIGNTTLTATSQPIPSNITTTVAMDSNVKKVSFCNDKYNNYNSLTSTYDCAIAASNSSTVTLKQGVTYRVTATTKSGYEVSSYTATSATITNNTGSHTDFTPSGNSTFTVTSTTNAPTHTVTVNMDSNVSYVTFTNPDWSSKTVINNGSTVDLRENTSYTVTAYVGTDYELGSWSTTANGVLSSTTTNPTTYTVSETATLTVTSQAIPFYTVTVNIDNNISSVGFYNANYGVQTVSSDGGTASLKRDISYVITATFSNGYELDSWSTTSNGSLASAIDNPTTYTIIGDSTLNVTSQVSPGPAPPASCNTKIPNVTYMQDITSSNKTTVLASLTTDRAYYLRDSRDGEPYCVSKLQDGNLWLLDNLRLDLTDSDVLNNTTASNTNASATSLGYLKNGGGTTSDQYATSGVVEWNDSQTYASIVSYSDPLIATSGNCGNSYCVNDPESGKWTKDSVATSYGNGSGKIGVYYNYCAASAGSYCYGNGTDYGTSSGNATEDLCPAGWRMPTGWYSGEYDALYTAYSGNSANYKTALSTPLSAYFNFGKADDQGSFGGFWSSTRYGHVSMCLLDVYSSNVDPAHYNYRNYGYSMRCLLDTIHAVTTVNFSGSGITSVTFSGDDTTQTVSTSGDTVRLKQGVNYTVTATASTGYEFSSWSTATNGTLSSTTTNPTTYTVSDNSTITVTGTEIPSYTTTVNLDSQITSVSFYHADYGTQTITNENAGTSSKTGTVSLRRGVPYTITATATIGYGFSAWTSGNDGTVGSASQNPTTFVITNDTTLSVTSMDQHVIINYDGNGLYYNNDSTDTINQIYYGDTTTTETATRYAHTSNVSDAGVASGNYSNSLNTTDTVTINGATSLNVTIYYDTESTSYDWVSVYQSPFDISASNDTTASATTGNLSGKLAGRNSSRTSDHSTWYSQSYTVTGDTVKFHFKSDSSDAYYGYYAVVIADVTTKAIVPLSGTYSTPSSSQTHVFLGWSENQNAAVPTYTNETDILSSGYTYSDSPITLYAIYATPQAVTVNMDANASSISFYSANLGSQTIINENVGTSGKSSTISLYDKTEYTIAATFATSYELGSWSTSANGALESISDNPTTYTISGVSTLSFTSQIKQPPTICNTPVPNVTYMQDITSSNRSTVLASLTEEAPYYLRDSRDEEPYCVSKLKDGNLWLLDNLRLDLTNSDVINNTTASNTNASATSLGYLKNGGGTTTDQYATTSVVEWTDSPTFASGYSYSDPLIATSGSSWAKDTTTTSYGNGSNKIGIYYNYCAASAGSYCYGNGASSSTSSGNATEDLCPAGWRMPTGGSNSEFNSLYGYYNTTTTATNTASLQYNLSTPLSGRFGGGSADYQGSIGYFWSSTRENASRMYSLSVGPGSVDTPNVLRDFGLSMRCLLDLIHNDTIVNFSGSGISSVTFEGNDTSQTVSISGGTVRLEQGVNYTVTATTSNGYELSLWSTSANGALSSTTSNPTTYSITGNSTLTVTGQVAPSYTVTVNMDNNVDSVGFYNADLGTQTVTTNGDTVSLYRDVEYTITGSYDTFYQFYSWATTANGTLGSTSADPTTFTVSGPATLTLTSIDRVCPGKKVCYMQNNQDVVGTMGDQSLSNNASTVTLLSSNFSRANYGFAGWNTQPDGSGTSYGPNETLTFTAGTYNTVGLKLYPIWVASTGSLQSWTGCKNMSTGDITALTDQRDSETYAVAKLDDGQCWMIENLRLEGENTTDAKAALAQGYGSSETFGTFSGLANAESSNFSDSTSANSHYSTNGSDDTVNIGTGNNPGYRMPRYNNINTASRADSPTSGDAKLYRYGNYYTWPAAIADTTYYASDHHDSTSICPTDWHLPRGGDKTSIETDKNEFYQLGLALVNAAPANYGSSTTPYWTGSTEGTNASIAFRAYPNNFIYSGYFASSSPSARNGGSYYWSSTASNATKSYLLRLDSSNVYAGTATANKHQGYSVRCIATPAYQVTVSMDSHVTSVDFTDPDGNVIIATPSNPTVKLREGIEYTLHADREYGYQLDAWTTTANGTLGSTTDNPTTYTVMDTATLTATSGTAGPMRLTYNGNGLTFTSDATTNTVSYDATRDINQATAYYSHTANIDDSGVATGTHASALRTKDVVTVPGADSLSVILYYSTQAGSDKVFPIEGEYTGSVSSSMSVAGQIGTYDGGAKTTFEEANYTRFNVSGDTVTFAFYSNNSTNYYGYYAIVVGLDSSGDYINSGAPLYTITDYYKTVVNGAYAVPNSSAPHDFLGWSENRNATIPTFTDENDVKDNYKKVNGDNVTLYAVYDKYLTIHFDGNGNDSGSMNDQTVKAGLSAGLTANGFSKVKHTFTGWNTAADGSGTRYSNQASFAAPVNTTLGQELTLYAQWIEDEDVTVNFEGVGITNVTLTNNTYGTQTITTSGSTAVMRKGLNYTITANIATGYEFISWATAANGNLNSTSVTPTTYVATGDTTLTLTAAEIPSYEVTVNFDSHVTSVGFYSSDYGTQQVTTSGGIVSLRRDASYIITASYDYGYGLDSWTTTADGTLGSATTSATTYVVTAPTTLSVSSQTVSSMVDFDSTACSAMNVGDTTYLYDSRDGNTYKIARLADNNCWMLDNLALDLTDSNVQSNLTSTTTNASDATLAYLKSGGGASPYPANGVSSAWTGSSQNSYNLPFIKTGFQDDVVNTKYGSGSGKRGIYYNYCAASAGSYCYATSAGVDVADTIQDVTEDICPAGWRLPTGGGSGELLALFTAITGSTATSPSGANATSFRTALSTPLSGYITSGSTSNLNGRGYFWTSTYSSTNNMFSLYVTSSNAYLIDNEARTRGHSIRCVKIIP